MISKHQEESYSSAYTQSLYVYKDLKEKYFVKPFSVFQTYDNSTLRKMKNFVLRNFSYISHTKQKFYPALSSVDNNMHPNKTCVKYWTYVG